MAEPKNKEEDQNAIPPETDWPKPSIRPPRQWSAGLKQFISNFGLLIVIIIGFIITIGCIYLLYDIIRTYFDTNNKNQFANLRNSLFILAALIGTPFFVWRTMLAAEQTKTAEKQATIAQEKSYTELFAKAIEQLGSVKQVGKDEYAPNIEVRVGALYALERIMKDSDKDAPAIIDTLTTYVKANCGKPKKLPHNIDQNIITKLQEKAPANRYDIQTALIIIGRRPQKHKSKKEMPNLTEVNMQGANLVRFNLALCNLANAHLQGAILPGVELQEAQLYGVNLQRAILHGANLQGAKLQEADLDEANLREADLQSADLDGAFLQGADMEGANLQEIDLAEVQITDAHKTAASVIWVDFTKAKYDFVILQEQVKDMFGHKTLTILPEGIKIPDHWSEANMETDEGEEQYYSEWEAFKKEKGVG